MDESITKNANKKHNKNFLATQIQQVVKSAYVQNFTNKGFEMDGRIFHLKEQLLKNPQHNWTIEEMSQTVELSIPHFQKLFKAETGIAPVTFLRDLRLEKARKFLETKFYRPKY